MDSLQILSRCDSLKAEMFLYRQTFYSSTPKPWTCKIVVPVSTGKLTGESDYYATAAEALSDAWSSLQAAQRTTTGLAL